MWIWEIRIQVQETEANPNFFFFTQISVKGCAGGHLDIGVLQVGEVAEGGEHTHAAQDTRETVSQGHDQHVP